MQITALTATILSIGAVATVTVAMQNTTATAQIAATHAVGDAIMTMPVLEDKGWFIHAHNGRVRACTVDGASVGEQRTPPRCSNWSE